MQHSDTSTYCHLFGWRNVIQKTYRHKPYYLAAKENDVIKGILLVFLMKCIPFGKRMASIPFLNYGGVCADDTETALELVEHAKEICQRKRANYLEFRHYNKNDFELINRTEHVTLLLDLLQGAEALWESFWSEIR